MSNLFFGRIGINNLSELYEERKLENENKKRRIREKEEERERNRHDFLLESRFELMQDSLNKSKVGTSEFDALLNECLNIYMEMNNIEHLDEGKKESIIKFIKSKALEDEITDKITSSKSENIWPSNGRITLRDAIDKKYLGQNPTAPESKKVKEIFGGEKKNNYPSPSSTKKN